jgi:hypothetical protein
MENHPEIARIKNRILKIEEVFDGEIKVLYRLSDLGKDVFLIKRAGVRMKLRILPLGDEELMQIAHLQRITDRRVAQVVDYRVKEEEIFLITTYFPGKTLYEKVREEGTLSEKAALAITRKIALILSELHGHKPLPLIFRDLQPKNIVVNHQEVYLIDIERITQYSPTRTHDTQIMGTVGFIAPEQYGFGQADARSDIYSLGMCLYFMLSGRIPEFRNQRVDFRQLNLSEPTRKLLLRMTDFSPEKRPASSDRVVDLIENRRIKQVSRWVGLTGVLLVVLFLIAGAYPGALRSTYPAGHEAYSKGGVQAPRGVFFHDIERVPYLEEGGILLGDFPEGGAPGESYELLSLTDPAQGPFEGLEVTYRFLEDRIQLSFDMDMKEASREWTFFLKRSRAFPLVSLEEFHPEGDYHFTLDLDTETVKHWVKYDPEGDDFYLAIDGFVQPIPLRKIFLRHGATLGTETVSAWVAVYDHYFKEAIPEFSLIMDKILIHAQRSHVIEELDEWQPVDLTLRAEGYLDNAIHFTPNQFKRLSLPMVKPREGILQGFIMDTVDHGGLIGVRVYLEEVVPEGRVFTLSRRDLYFEDIAFYSFAIESDKNYLVRYEILEKNPDFFDEGYVTMEGVTPHFVKAWVINENQALKRTVNINLVEKK